MLLIVDGDPLVFRSTWNKNSMEEAQDRYYDMLNDITDRCFADEVKIAVWGDNNFRIDFYDDYNKLNHSEKNKLEEKVRRKMMEKKGIKNMKVRFFD